MTFVTKKMTVSYVVNEEMDAYVRHMLLRARTKGWRVFVFNSLGCGDSPVTTPQVNTVATLYVYEQVLVSLFRRNLSKQNISICDTDVQFYLASFLGDMREVVSHVTGRYPNANVYSVGWSVGANILVRYLGQVASLLIPAKVLI